MILRKGGAGQRGREGRDKGGRGASKNKLKIVDRHKLVVV